MWGEIQANAVEASVQQPSLGRNTSFLLLWAGQFVSQMGDRLAMVALPWLIYQGTESALQTGAVFALYTLPYVLFGTFAGVAIDRFDKRGLMVAADVLRAGLLVLVPLAAGWSIPLVYALAFLVSSAGVIFDPAKLALLPDIVAPQRLMRANSVMSIGENLTEIVGYTLAGFLLAYVSTTTAFRVDALTFLISAGALALMRYEAPIRSAAIDSRASFWREIAEGLAFLGRHRGLMANTVMVCASAAGLGATYPLSFLYAVQVLDGGTKAFGVFGGSTGLGFLIGSLALATVATRVRKGWAMTIGLASMGASLAAVAATETTWQAAIAFGVFGLANACALIAVDTYLQSIVPERLRGRVFGVRFTLTQGIYALSVLVAGALASVVDIRALFVVAGALIAIPAIAGAVRAGDTRRLTCE